MHAMFHRSRRLFRLSPALGRQIARLSSGAAKDDLDPSTYELLGNVSLICGCITLTAAVSSYLLDKKEEANKRTEAEENERIRRALEAPGLTRERLIKITPALIEKACVDKTILCQNFVARPKLRAAIQEALSTKNPVNYYFIYGPRGAGKTEIVAQTAAEVGNKYVVWHKVSSPCSEEELASNLFKTITGETANMTDIDLRKAIINFREQHDGECPTIIFDIERGAGDSYTLSHIKGLAKFLVNFCQSIIVLPEASDIERLRGDHAREEFVYVDEMAISEAKEYMTKAGANYQEKELDYIFNNIGTSPAVLRDLINTVGVKKEKTLEQFVNTILQNARNDLDKFPVKPILKALQTHPEGVSLDHFNGQPFEILSPHAVFSALRRAVAGTVEKPQIIVVFRPELYKYQLLSTAHKTALKTFKFQEGA